MDFCKTCTDGNSCSVCKGNRLTSDKCKCPPKTYDIS